MMKLLVLVALWFFSFSLPATPSQVIDDKAALADLTVAKGVFLIDFNSPRKTAFYLEIIHSTYQGLLAQDVKPDLVLVFIGETVKYLSSDPEDLLFLEYETELASIAESVRKFNELGVRMEVCAIATRVFGIDNKSILPGMTIVGDGFISLIGWQAQGYHLVPIF